MTVAAVILCTSAESALADAAGRPAARRMAETAWAGGAMPIVVVAPEDAGRVAASLSGCSAILAEPALGTAGPVAQMARGIAVAVAAVTETSAALLWPGRLTWVDAETVTSLIQAHGLDDDTCLRPSWAGQAGWPALLPVSHLPALAALPPGQPPDAILDDLAAAGVPFRDIDLGDPGVVVDRATTLEDLPPFVGPAAPLAAAPEWGSAAADASDDAPLAGPALAPLPQAD